MADESSQYDTTVEWQDGRRGTTTSGERHAIAIGAPREFGGSDDVWSPEHLCVAAVNACVMLTFLTVAANSKVPVRAYTASAHGTLARREGRGPEITRVVVRPRITVGPGVDRGKVERLIKMAEKNCFISNSLKAEVMLEAEITVG